MSNPMNRDASEFIHRFHTRRIGPIHVLRCFGKVTRLLLSGPLQRPDLYVAHRASEPRSTRGWLRPASRWPHRLVRSVEGCQDPPGIWAAYSGCSDSGGTVSSNENKISDSARGRASLAVLVWKSSQKWSAQRSAVRSIAWLDVWRRKPHFRLFSSLNSMRTFERSAGWTRPMK